MTSWSSSRTLSHNSGKSQESSRDRLIAFADIFRLGNSCLRSGLLANIRCLGNACNECSRALSNRMRRTRTRIRKRRPRKSSAPREIRTWRTARSLVTEKSAGLEIHTVTIDAIIGVRSGGRSGERSDRTPGVPTTTATAIAWTSTATAIGCRSVPRGRVRVGVLLPGIAPTKPVFNFIMRRYTQLAFLRSESLLYLSFALLWRPGIMVSASRHFAFFLLREDPINYIPGCCMVQGGILSFKLNVFIRPQCLLCSLGV